MLKHKFDTQDKLDVYISEQNIRKERGYLTVSERKQLDDIIKTPNNYIHKLDSKEMGLSLVTDIDKLKQPCINVEKGENISEIIKDLKNTLKNSNGVGITANQIGYNKKISYISMPKLENQQIKFDEYILINAKIIEHDRPIQVKNERCLSFPGIGVDTKRYVFITVEYYNEKMELKTGMFQDMEALCIQHEIDHQNGIVLFQRKWGK